MQKKYIYNLPELIDLLLSEHDNSYVYRGQIKKWPGPLVPSGWRGLLCSSGFTEYSRDYRLREIGTAFYLQDLSLKPNDEIEYKKRQIWNRHITGIFGYPLGQILMQQFGYNSEGLDVTKDPIVAAFFAKFNFDSKSFITEFKDTGVLYRWPVATQSLLLEDIQRMDFFTCFPYMDAVACLAPIATDHSNHWIPELTKKNILNYIDELVYYWNRGNPRPLELLNLPAAIIYMGRVAKQKGGLLLPDMILGKKYLEDKYCPEHKINILLETNAIEDLSTRPGVEIFHFHHKSTDKRYFKQKPECFFPDVNDDPLLFLLSVTRDYPGKDILSVILDQNILLFNSDVPPYYNPFSQ